jgi:hypothetical protein
MDTLTAELEEFERSDREAAQRSGDGSHLAESFREESEEMHHEEGESRHSQEGETPRS